MTTILRVKRLRGDDPVEALVLSCKRKKTEDSDANQDLFKKVFNFSGTVDDKDDKVAKRTVRSFNKEWKYSDLTKKNHTPEIRLKRRQEQRERSEDSRFTLLSCLRSDSAVESAEIAAPGDSKENFTIVDVSKDCDQKTVEHDAEGSYVYDLYSMQESDCDFNDLYMENLLSICPLETELDYRNVKDYYEEEDPEEDDSNDENNWRNDYPDTESSLDEDESGDILARKLRGCHLDDGYDLSGDSDEEEFLHYNDEESYHYYEAEDLAGKKYAKYKANALKQMIEENDPVSSDADESEDDFHDCEVFSYHGDSD